MLKLEAMTALSTLIDAARHRPPARPRLGSLFRPCAAARSLRWLDIEPTTFLSVLAGLDADADWTVRVALAAALGGLPGEQGVPRLTVMLQDRDGRVIPAVLNALIAAKAGGMDKVLLDRLKSDDFVVRATAANGLAEIKATGAVQPLTEAYRASAGGDVTYVARASSPRRAREAGPGRRPPTAAGSVDGS